MEKEIIIKEDDLIRIYKKEELFEFKKYVTIKELIEIKDNKKVSVKLA